MKPFPHYKGFIYGGLALVGLTAGAFLFHHHRAKPQDPLEPMLELFSAEGLDYADPAHCVECHREETEAWQTSHHAMANAPLTDEDRDRLLKAAHPLLELRGMRWQAGNRAPVLKESGLPDYPVVGTIGITPLIQYLHLAPDGRLQTHDVAWDVEKEEWFSVFERDDEEPRIPGEWGHWTGQGMNWDANCAYCHMTEFRKNYDPESDSYALDWSHMTITCAQCHPGMDTHLSQIRNGNNAFTESLDKVQIMHYCASCHSRREQLTPDDFSPGDLYEDHFQLTLADEPGIYHPDGQVIGENYVYGSLTMSKMGHAGVTCMDCHDPHSGGHILPFENNALCQRCHGSGLQDAPRIDPLAHSRHPAESTGNLCVECHMPVSYFMGRDGRRDHSFSHPDPQLTLELGIPNACTQCHNTQSDQWALRYTNEWYGEDMNADRREKARLISALHSGTSGSGARLMAALEKEQNRFWKATFISLFRFAGPQPGAVSLLEGFLDDPDPMVRSAAVRILGTDSLDPAKKMDLLYDPTRLVRIGASLSLPDLKPPSGEGDAELRAYLRHNADSPVGAIRYAAYWSNRGDAGQARASLLQAVEFEPLNPEVWRQVAIQLHNNGFSSDAFDFLDKALELSPEAPRILFNLGLLANESNRPEDAIRYLLRTVEADPKFEDAWYNLVVLYWSLGDVATARQYLQTALTHLPDSPRLRNLRP